MIRRRYIQIISIFLILEFISLSANADESVIPEARDPVLGERAAIVEWAWSAKYASRFGLPVQADGLKNGDLWLLGIKVMRVQDGSDSAQTYQCRIAGLIDNKAPILWPPGERYVIHPGYRWIGGLPGKVPIMLTEQRNYVPAQSTWYKNPKNQRQKNFPLTGTTTLYLIFNQNFTEHLAYFELDGSCERFKDPVDFRNELRFPTRIDGKNDDNPRDEAVFEMNALKFDFPDSLMKKIYPFTIKAADWSWCMSRRSGRGGEQINIYNKEKLKRIGKKSC